ncbi:hypothetical protein [Marinomonas mediterranea]|uniref:Capsule polysaccharide biosynthesis protein n=1 Tax=Marinomonas mediterranea (strain ATCC 700492 / JCM 21426 / NBRC 103028 / MMB-1) TaxID=717774 RepID=F2K164_MARM1|nr:hypothetical protein [Marinomonas mediterranea]ADZ89914.1 hypothetical protein Marme_0620 [Marinomonas mediterranea MMB-1]WCN07998.1 hypothetical protein GV055_03180 [Marinomonas mediterranea]WCN12093.1 hypothetical protein GV054_03190 [Marinomonas mediterranea]WCN16131.1 hypothetical protein GV053_03125 [Marinomonas mediterranea MMB-1]
MMMKNVINKLVRRVFPTIWALKYAFKYRKGKNKAISDSNGVVLLEFSYSLPVIECYRVISDELLLRSEASELELFSYSDDRYDKYFSYFSVKYFLIYHLLGFKFNFSNLKLPSCASFRDLKEKFSSKQELLGFKFDSIVIGDLIYDTYLRKKKVSTVDLSDEYLFYLVKIACFMVTDVSRNLMRKNVKSVVCGDVAYIYSGVMARVAISKEIPCYCFDDRSGLIVRKMDETYFRRAKYWNYKTEFQSLPNKAERIAQARSSIESRLAGSVASLSYMGKSSFSAASKDNSVLDIISNNDKPTIVIMLHCFFDSPHIYRNAIFPDFYEWCNYLRGVIERTNYNWVIKPHPNGLAGNEEVIYAIFKNTRAFILEPEVSNLDIVNSSPDLVLTVYGTVAHEFSYCGIPVLNAGDNPHIDYSFCITAKNINEYDNYLLNLSVFFDFKIDKEDILEFYYMNYLSEDCLSERCPSYPPADFIDEYKLNSLSPKERRLYYHYTDATFKYFLDNEVKSDVASIIER